MPRVRRFFTATLAIPLLFTGLAITATTAPSQAAPIAEPAAAAAAAAVPASVLQTVLFNKGDYGYGCYRIPAIVRTNDGDLLAFAEARRTWCADAQEIDLVMRKSIDNGAN